MHKTDEHVRILLLISRKGSPDLPSFEYNERKNETIFHLIRKYLYEKGGEDTMPTKDERVFAALIYVISFFTAFIGPLVIWLLKKDSSQFVDYHGREYLNFFISYTVYSIVAGILTIVLVGFVLLPVIGIALVVFTIIAAVRAYEGTDYRFPLIFRIL